MLIKKSLTYLPAISSSDSAGTQTQDPQLRRLLLYSAELPNQTFWKTEYSPYSRKIFYVAFSTIVDCECKGNNFFVALQKKIGFSVFVATALRLHCGIAVVGNGFEEVAIYGLKNLALKHYAGQVAHVVA